MEILNKNQRQTAIWRLVGMGLLVLAANAAIVLAIHRHYATVGSGPMDEMKRQLATCQAKLTGATQGPAGKIKELEAKVKAMEAEKAATANEYKMMKMRNEFLEKDILRWQMMANSRPPGN